LVLTDEERKAKDSARHKKNRENPEKLAKIKKNQEKQKERIAFLNTTPEYKSKRKVREQKPKRKARRKEIREDRRLKVLQHYSTRLSKSDIPCCNCCGEHLHIDFLAIDHIAGRRQMDSEPELVKLGYSSKLKNTALIKWLIDNDCPEGFQILCHNCNFTKSLIKNKNECPMKNKIHQQNNANLLEKLSKNIGSN
jgi:hypothetical protein